MIVGKNDKKETINHKSTKNHETFHHIKKKITLCLLYIYQQTVRQNTYRIDAQKSKDQKIYITFLVPFSFFERRQNKYSIFFVCNAIEDIKIN